MIDISSFQKHLIKFKQNSEIEELNYLLDQGNYFLEIFLNHYYELKSEKELEFFEKTFPENKTFVGFFYKNKLLFNRYELNKELKQNSNIISRADLVNDLNAISAKMIFFYRAGLMNDLEKLLQNYSKQLIEEYNTHPSLEFFYADLVFIIKGIPLFCLDDNGNTEEEIFNIKYDIAHFREEVGEYSDFVDITKESFYKELEPDSREFVKAATQLGNLVNQNTDIILIDYSPLLLDFTKAVEHEIRTLYLIHYDEIIQIAERIKMVKNNLYKSEDAKIRYLCQMVNSIMHYKQRYSPSGLKPLYYFLKFFALPSQHNELPIYDGFLTINKRNLIYNNKNLINRLLNFGNLRNDYVHSEMIRSKEEYLMNQYDLVLTLRLLAELKEI